MYMCVNSHVLFVMLQWVHQLAWIQAITFERLSINHNNAQQLNDSLHSFVIYSIAVAKKSWLVGQLFICLNTLTSNMRSSCVLFVSND